MHASRSIAFVREGPPLPPAPVSKSISFFHPGHLTNKRGKRDCGVRDVPALQMTHSAFVLSRMAFACASLFTSSKLSTRTSIFPGPFLPASRISAFWSGFRITEVMFQERERSLGVMRRETFPCPPRRRIRGAAIVLFTCI
jgi:hypothetical protein